MKTNEIRQKYLDFFGSKDHTVVPSDVLVPKWDKTVLFTPAGMNQFKDHFLGNVELEYTRATTSQKCLRTGDIENVGRTAYHHTFFEMLGNFSFGDYFKRDAIHWAWEFLTDKKWLAINPDQLTVSVYTDDDEAANIWHKEVGLPLKRIARLGEHDNFWPAGAPSDGPDGVCGPCSEIFFHPENGPECEIWNLVFTQFNREGDPPENLVPLPTKNIDTGMGLERIAATMQGVTTNFHVDTLRPIVEAAAEVVGVAYDPDSENGRRLRRIADHVRACTMAIHENVYPGPQKEEYVIRRLLRRAVLQGHEMGLRDPFLAKIVPAVIEQMKEPYPELVPTAERIETVITNEEQSFFGSLDEGLARIESIFKKMKSENSTTVSGDEAADLYQTNGIPAELFAGIAEERRLKFDWPGYQAAMDRHAEDSGKGSKGVMGDFGPLDEIKKEIKTTEFLGYQSPSSEAVIVGLVEQTTEIDSDGERDGEIETTQVRKTELKPCKGSVQYVVLDQSPFYAESGGQIGDTGVIIGPSGSFEVTDTQKTGDVILHLGRMVKGSLVSDDPVEACVDEPRHDAIRRAHSATHVLHYALQQNLGEHAQQRGSKVTDDLLRFDFSNLTAVEPDKLAAIEKLAIEKIRAGGAVVAETVPLETAKKRGAMMLFGEKYPDPVRMISIGEFSKELCGGTHLGEIRDVEAFEIIAEESVSSGTRRIQALTGQKAIAHQQQITESATAIAVALGAPISGILAATERLMEDLKSLKKQVAGGQNKSPSQSGMGANSSNSAGAAGSRMADKDLDYFQIRDSLKAVAARINVPLPQVEDRITSIGAEIDQLHQQLDKLASAGEIKVDDLIASAITIGQMQVIVKRLENANPALMKNLVDQIRQKIGSVAVFFATSPTADKVLLTAGFSRDLVDGGLSAGDWIRAVAPVVGGGGGGKPDLAQAGGKLPEKIEEALEAAVAFLK